MSYRLPPETGDFVGRGSAVAELTAALTPRGRAVPVAAVSGMGGIGKTTLAVQVAHVLRSRFPDGHLYVDLHGLAGRPVEPYAVLDGLLHALGRHDVPDGAEERAALYRSELSGRRMLVLLDDARRPAQVRPLLPGATGSAVLVTSRATMAGAGLPGARQVDLDVLEPDEAMDLLTSVAGTERVTAEHGAALDLVAACGFLPLAIRGAGAWLAARPSLGIGVLVRLLMRGRVEELPAAVACFGVGYDLLGSDEARAFRLLALADGPGFSTGAAGAALGMRRQCADDLLETLTDLSLLECTAPGRYRFHDLLRLFALNRTGRGGERARALHGLLGHYLTAARCAARTLGAVDPPASGAGRLGWCGDLATPEAVRTWLFVEQDAILTAVERAAAEPGGPLTQAAELLLTVAQLLDGDWRSVRMRSAASALRAAALRQEDPLSRTSPSASGIRCVTRW